MKVKKARKLKRFFTDELIVKKMIKKYICPLCDTERDIYDRTAVLVGKQWIKGCQNCFLKSIEDEPIIS